MMQHRLHCHNQKKLPNSNLQFPGWLCYRVSFTEWNSTLSGKSLQGRPWGLPSPVDLAFSRIVRQTNLQSSWNSWEWDCSSQIWEGRRGSLMSPDTKNWRNNHDVNWSGHHSALLSKSKDESKNHELEVLLCAMSTSQPLTKWDQRSRAQLIWCRSQDESKHCELWSRSTATLSTPKHDS